jgi:hypothetical protein
MLAQAGGRCGLAFFAHSRQLEKLYLLPVAPAVFFLEGIERKTLLLGFARQLDLGASDAGPEIPV